MLKKILLGAVAIGVTALAAFIIKTKKEEEQIEYVTTTIENDKVKIKKIKQNLKLYGNNLTSIIHYPEQDLSEYSIYFDQFIDKTDPGYTFDHYVTHIKKYEFYDYDLEDNDMFEELSTWFYPKLEYLKALAYAINQEGFNVYIDEDNRDIYTLNVFIHKKGQTELFATEEDLDSDGSFVWLEVTYSSHLMISVYEWMGYWQDVQIEEYRTNGYFNDDLDNILTVAKSISDQVGHVVINEERIQEVI